MKVYIDPVEFGDDMAALQYRLSKGVYFHMAGLTECLVFMKGIFHYLYSYSHNLKAPLKIYRQKSEFYQIGLDEIRIPGGHMVKVYNGEGTLCNILRTRDQLDAETIKQASGAKEKEYSVTDGIYDDI